MRPLADTASAFLTGSAFGVLGALGCIASTAINFAAFTTGFFPL
jgi:hypothetical protein